MKPIPCDAYGPAPADDPLAYPGRTPDGSFVYADGEVWALEDGEGAAAADRFLRRRGAADSPHRYPVLCLGSNACPPQVRRKLAGLAGDRSVLFLRSRVRGVQPVYAGHVARYGAVPASGDGGGEEDLFVALYTAAQLAATYASEHGNYDLCHLPSVRAELPGGRPLPRVWAFLSVWGVLSFNGGEAVRLDAVPQRELRRRLLERSRPHAGATAVSAEDYAAHPARHRRSVEEAIRRHGLRRPPSLTAHPVGLDEVQPLG
jgi:hypothetical protein